VFAFLAPTTESGCAQEMNNTQRVANRATTQKLINIFVCACKVAFPMLGIAVVLALSVPLCVADLPTKMLTAKLTFAGLGLLFAILQVFLGVLLALIGVTIDYNVDASVGSAKVKLASSSPGILLVLVGTALFAFSLKGDFEVTSAMMRPNEPKSRANSTAADQSESVPPLRDVKGPE